MSRRRALRRWQASAALFALVVSAVALTVTTAPPVAAAVGRPASEPQAVTARISAVNSTIVSWDAPLDAGDYPVTGYQIVVFPGGQTLSAAATDRSITITPSTPSPTQSTFLDKYHHFTFTVAAVTAQGVGRSAIATNADTSLLPAAPTDLTAKWRGGGTALFDWSAVSDPRDPLLGSKIMIEPGGQIIETTVTFGGQASIQGPWTITSIRTGTKYRFRVSVYNNSGASPWSELSPEVDPYSPRGSLAVSTMLDQTGQALWFFYQPGPAEADGRVANGYGAHTYQQIGFLPGLGYYQSPPDHVPFHSGPAILSSPGGTSFTTYAAYPGPPGLNNSAEYGPESPGGGPLTGDANHPDVLNMAPWPPIPPPGSPPPPPVMTATRTGATKVHIEWAKYPAPTEGNKVGGAYMYIVVDGAGLHTVCSSSINTVAPTGTDSCDVNLIYPGERVRIRQMINGTTETQRGYTPGPTLTLDEDFSRLDKPPAPTGVTAQLITSQTLRVNWTPPTWSAPFQSISGYRINVETPGGQITTTVAAGATTGTVGVPQRLGEQIKATVTTLTNALASDRSAPVSLRWNDRMAAPSRVTGTPIGTNKVRVSWTAAALEPWQRQDAYDVYLSPGGKVGTVTGTGTSLDVTLAAPAERYDAYVVARTNVLDNFGSGLATGLGYASQRGCVWKCAEPLTLTTYGPADAGQGETTFTLTGAGIDPGATAQLERDGAPPLASKLTTIDPDGRWMKVMFDLSNEPLGPHTLRVTNPNGQTATKPVTVVPASGPLLSVDVMAPKNATLHNPGASERPQRVSVVVTNNGNTDADMVPVIVDAPPDADLVRRSTVLDVPPGVVKNPSITPGPWPVPADGDGPARKVDVTVLPTIPPGGSQSTRYDVVNHSPGPAGIGASVAPCSPVPDATGPTVGPSGWKCLYSLVAFGMEFLDAGDCLKVVQEAGGLTNLGPAATEVASTYFKVNAAKFAAKQSANSLIATDASGFAIDYGGVVKLAIDAILKCAVFPLITNASILKVVKMVYKATKLSLAAGAAYKACAPVVRRLFGYDVVGSADPNELIGPTGSGAERWATPGVRFPYSILFENKSTATAPAQTVVVEGRLEPGEFDLSTAELGPITFGATTITPPAGVKTWHQRVDLSPAQDLFVDVDGSMNPTTGALRWSLKAVDPSTGELPEDPLVGFLPPNNDAHAGEGHVEVSAVPLDTAHGATVDVAPVSIVFDVNAPIATEAWSNAIDTSSPETQVTAEQYGPSGSTIDLTWSGTDTGSGIDTAELWYSDNGNPATLLATSTDGSEVETFTGALGHTYTFWSQAEDHLGHKEGAPETPDATVLVGPGTGAVSGTITSTAGGPVVGGYVRLYKTKSLNAVVAEADVTSASGGYTVSGVAPGTYYLYAGKSGAYYSRWAATPVVITAEVVSDMDLALTPGAGATGTITGGSVMTGPSGPLVGATVRVYSNGNPTSFRSVTDSTGRYNLTGLLAGTYTVVTTAYGYAVQTSAPFTVTADTTQAPSPDIDLVAAPITPGLTGKVTDPGGASLGGVSVRLWLAGSAATSNVRSATTAADGTWTIGSIPAGDYRVQYAKSGYTSGYYGSTVTIGGTTTATRLESTFATSGTITGSLTPGS